MYVYNLYPLQKFDSMSGLSSSEETLLMTNGFSINDMQQHPQFGVTGNVMWKGAVF